ncbi:transposase [Sphingomonas sp. AAP5]|nr:transposase [Sphingomonas sp. AAP5]
MLGERIGVSDEEWALIGSLLPPEHGRGCRPASDNWRYFEGMMWMARSGAQWRLLPDEYRKWNSVFRRYRRWVETLVFDALLETLAEMVERDTGADMIDSTVVRAHHCAVDLKRGSSGPGAWPVARRLHYKTPRPLRRTLTTARLRLDAGADQRCEGLWPVVPDARRPHRGAARGQGLRRRCYPHGACRGGC